MATCKTPWNWGLILLVFLAMQVLQNYFKQPYLDVHKIRSTGQCYWIYPDQELCVLHSRPVPERDD